MVRPAEADLRQDLVRLRGEFPIGVEQQLHARAKFLFAQEKLVHARFYVSHVDVIGAIRYKWVNKPDINEQSPRDKRGFRQFHSKSRATGQRPRWEPPCPSFPSTTATA
ncbi:protein of unknown function (plasmid) [Azospirillum baldaniorum]|uniref:Uncharacterized protein n=1 Tax=Azospirillum baldaniorum TaxID=1064539 RepID=A0A9P1JUG7_9PROT|nr:protein of unknown function [Azospirillum baldaniorum]